MYIYSIRIKESTNMRYKLYKKFFKKIECDYLCLGAANVLVAHKHKLISYNFTGETDRQWSFESPITAIVACGGPSKKDLILIGLKNGTVYKVFLDNSFPVNVFKL